MFDLQFHVPGGIVIVSESVQRLFTELRAGFTRRTAERRAACPILSTARKRRAAVRNRCSRRLGRRATIHRLVSSCEELAGPLGTRATCGPLTSVKHARAGDA